MKYFFTFIFIFLSFFFSLAQDTEFEIKEYAKHAPYSVSGSPQKLVRYLTEHEVSDLQKAFNIYTWVIFNIKADIDGQASSLSYSNPKKVLKKGKGDSHHISKLYSDLCEIAGIPAKEIFGYSKGAKFTEVETFYEATHIWNGIKIDSTWFLLDLTWGQGYTDLKKQVWKEFKYKNFKKPYLRNKYKFYKAPNYEYFKRAPEFFLKDHLPVDPAWQLVDYPVSLQAFESNSWQGYQYMLDSSFANLTDSHQFIKVLAEYEKLPTIVYLYRTGEKALSFNNRNYKLLAVSYYKKASEPIVAKDDLTKQLEQNKEAINDYNLAVANAKRHQSFASKESQKAINLLKNRIKSELIIPSNYRKNVVDRQLQKNKESIQNQKIAIRDENEKFKKLENQIITKKDRNFQIKSYAKVKDLELVEKNKIKIEENFGEINFLIDSINNLQGYFQELLADKSQLQSIIVDQNLHLNNLIRYNSASIIDNLNLSALSFSMAVVDSVGLEVDTSNDELHLLDREIRNILRAINKVHSIIISKARQNQNMVIQNCKFSQGAVCDEVTFNDYNILINEIYKHKIDNQKWFLEMKENRAPYHKEIKKVLKQQYKLLNNNLSLINFYQTQKIAEIEFKRLQSDKDTEKIIQRSTKGIKDLNAQNLKLRQEIRAIRYKGK
jgi:hypothetical protein